MDALDKPSAFSANTRIQYRVLLASPMSLYEVLVPAMVATLVHGPPELRLLRWTRMLLAGLPPAGFDQAMEMVLVVLAVTLRFVRGSGSCPAVRAVAVFDQGE